MMARWPWWGPLLISATLLALAACASSAPPQETGAGRQGGAPAAPSTQTTAPPFVPTSPPEWLTGDEWTFGWTSGANTGTKVVAIVGSMEIGGTRYYLARVGDMDHLYTRDLPWAVALRTSPFQL